MGRYEVFMFDERRGAQLVGDSEISLIKASLNDLSEKINLVHQESPFRRRGDLPAASQTSLTAESGFHRQ